MYAFVWPAGTLKKFTIYSFPHVVYNALKVKEKLKKGNTADTFSFTLVFAWGLVQSMKLSAVQKKRIRQVSWILFLIYIAAMAYFLFFSEELNRTGMEAAKYHYNLEFFKEIRRAYWCLNHGTPQYFLLNVVMNVVAFMPFGFILPIISQKNRKFGNVALLSLELTLCIEILQLLLKVGIFDVDDIFLNTAGGILGYIAFTICHRLSRKK